MKLHHDDMIVIYVQEWIETSCVDEVGHGIGPRSLWSAIRGGHATSLTRERCGPLEFVGAARNVFSFPSLHLF
jgi:hypothetical protein